MCSSSLMVWRLIAAGCFCAVSMMACGPGGRPAGDTAVGKDTAAVSASGISFDNDTSALVFSAYIALQEALVKSDADQAGKAAHTLAEELNTIEGCENTAVLASQMANSNDLSLQRSAFSTVSRDLIDLFKHAERASGTLYVIHCPMYNNNEGADWLAVSPDIRNPYFGDEMLTCGAVKEEIR